MGTWSTGILDNDTSAEVYEDFFKLYNQGKNGTEISNILLSQLNESLKDKEEHNNILFALAFAQWEISDTNKELYQNVQKIIESEDDLNLWKELGADEVMLKSRQRELNKFLKKISILRAKPKARQKPSVVVESELVNGNCLTFQFPDKTYGGFALINCEFYENYGSISLAFTQIKKTSSPAFEDFKNTAFLDCSWSESQDTITQTKYKVAGISCFAFEYKRKTERQLFFNFIQENFKIIGTLPKFEKGYHSTRFADINFSDKKRATIDGWNGDLSKYLDYLFNEPNQKKDKVKLKDFSTLTKK